MMILTNKLHLASLLVLLVAFSLCGCTNGNRSYKVTSVTYSKGIDTLFEQNKTTAFKNALLKTTLDITIQDDTLMLVKGFPMMPELKLHRIKARKNSDMPKYTYRISNQDGNTLDISLSGATFKELTIRTRALYLFPEKIGANKLALSSSDTRKWQATVEIKGEKL